MVTTHTASEHKTSGLRPRTLFRIFATAEMFTWAGLIAGIILRGMDVVNIVSITGGLHGFVFLCYAVTTVFVWINQKWKTSVGLTGLLLAVIPFATLPFDIIIDRKGLLNGGWRLAPGGEKPRGFWEHLQAWILRNPILAVVLLILIITGVYFALLAMGPPVPRSE